jgi:hypothetical protein
VIDQSEPPQGMERRMVLRLLHQWREAGGDDGFPKLDDFDQAALAEVWSECYLLNVTDNPDNPLFEKVGQAFFDECGRDVSGQRVSEIANDTLLYNSMNQMGRVLKKGVPISLGGQFTNAADATVLYRSILLPLSDDNKTIKQLLGAANCRIVTED